jgi:hypothetical protein
MTEAEWLACTDTLILLESMPLKVSERKMRLFTCAFCRRFWKLISDDRIKGLIRLSEGRTETTDGESELKAVWHANYARGFVCAAVVLIGLLTSTCP